MVKRPIIILALLCAGLLARNCAAAGAANHFSVSAPASTTAGNAFNFTVTALDASNATATGYAGTVHFTSTDGQAVLPANSALTNGVGTFSATLKTAGTQKVIATDTVTSSITGSSANINIVPAAATHFTISAPANATAGGNLSFSVTAQDQFNNTAIGYTGTVRFTSSDAQAVLPADATLTNGTGTFSATLKTAGSQTITATDNNSSAITGTSNMIAVSAAAAAHFSVSAPSSATAGSAFACTVTAQDLFNNTATGYTGTVHFTSTDSQAVLPLNSSLTNGVGTFATTLRIAGSRTITATDTVTSSITGTSNPVAVSPAGATHFTVSAPGIAAIGIPIAVSVTARDQFQNTATGYAGTVHLTSSDAAAVLPPNNTLTNGVGTFNVTLNTPPTKVVFATDTVNATITGSSTTIAVLPPAAPSFGAATVATFSVGSMDAFNIAGLGVPSPTLRATGTLPQGLQFNETGSGFGQISGTPAAGSGGQYVLRVTADNGLPPVATKQFLVLVFEVPALTSVTATPQVAGVGQIVTFNAAATGGPDAPNIAWNFGDGSTGTGASVTHAYTSAGTFNVSVTASDILGNSASGGVPVIVNPLIVGTGIDSDGDGFSNGFEQAAGTDANNLASTPTGQPVTQAAVKLLTVTKASIKLNFAKANSDSIAFSGTLDVPAGFAPSGAKVGVDAGGVSAAVTLDKKGSAKFGGAVVKLSIKSKKGIVEAQTAKYSVSLSKGAFAAALAASGLTNADAGGASVVVTFSLTFNGQVLQKVQGLSYTATHGKSGTAK